MTLIPSLSGHNTFKPIVDAKRARLVELNQIPPFEDHYIDSLMI